MITYKPLWRTLINKEMKKLDLVEKGWISRGTLAKLGKNQHVSTGIIERICEGLDCSISDVMEYVRESPASNAEAANTEQQ